MACSHVFSASGRQGYLIKPLQLCTLLSPSTPSPPFVTSEDAFYFSLLTTAKTTQTIKADLSSVPETGGYFWSSHVCEKSISSLDG